jgi:hypothetical protein
VEEHVKRARKACRALCRVGYAPFAPHLFYTQFLKDDDALERRVGMEAGHAFMAHAQGILYRPDGVISQGMRTDLAVAKAMGKEILELVSLDPPTFVTYEGSAVAVGSTPRHLRVASVVD